VAILGDRAGHGKSVRARFLGHEAEFPAGPYLLAATLGCPLYLTISIYTAPNRYDLYCEPFASEVALPRGSRQEALAALVQRYADRLEHYCRLAPYNWFNFFPFWSLRDGPSLPPAPPVKLNETTIP
jgi:predicted LPLAT superfamily acyltransferase